MLCRLLEKIIHSKVTHHLLKNNLINKEQHGFITKRSTLSQQLNLLDKITDNFDHNLQTELLYLDFSKAFDRVSHQKLLYILPHYKINPIIINWLQDYLTCRQQKTVIDGHSSNTCYITSGVPQGSVLGPLLFVIYVNQLITELKNKCSNIHIFGFADDVKLLSSDPNSLQDALDIVSNWTYNWQLPIQPLKSEHITFRRGQSQTPKFQINNNYFITVDTVKDLGLYITDTLKWTQNITNISSKANYLTYNILKTFNTPDINLYILLYKTYIRPIVEYNTSIWTPHLITEIRQIEAVQKRFTRKLCQKLNISFKDYKHRLGLLNIESLEYRRIKFDLILLYKIFNNLIDVDFNQLFKLSEVTDKYNLRRHVLHLQKPKFAKTSIRNNFFSYRIINIWNRLPEVCVCSPTLAVFKKNLNSTNLYCVHNFVF